MSHTYCCVTYCVNDGRYTAIYLFMYKYLNYNNAYTYHDIFHFVICCTSLVITIMSELSSIILDRILLDSMLLDSMLLDSMLLDSMLLDSVILDSSMLDSMLLDSMLLDSVILDRILLDNNNNNNNIYLKSNIQCTYRYEFSGLYNNNIQLQ